MKLWEPTQEAIAASELSKFAAHSSYAELHRWSVNAPDEFWGRVWEYSNVLGSYSEVYAPGKDITTARWFPGGKLNFAENLLTCTQNKPALVFRSETGEDREISYPELSSQVRSLASSLQEMGVQTGDRVAGVLPNLPEAVIAMLACASIGAVWSSCSPDFGTPTILDRLEQIQPKVLFTVNGYTYGGKPFDCSAKNQELVDALGIKHWVGVSFLDGAECQAPYRFQELTEKDVDFSFERFEFNQPLYILFSSGTTGKPKCIVHGAGGTLLQHRKEHLLHCNITEKDSVFYYTTCGWMMWNWLVSALASQATVVLYDGSPTYPKADALFDLVDEKNISVFGTSAKYLAAIENLDVRPQKTHQLQSLNSILSTGSPLLDESFDYVYRDIKTDLRLSSISGGTDIVSCFVLGNPCLPVYRGEIQCLGLGMDVRVYQNGREAPPGEPGELVCASPFPSMPIYFWNDPEGQRYHQSYFSRIPGVWCHGDWCLRTENGGVVIKGRSDTTLNPGGVRIGTAEIYRQVEALEEVAESLVVGQLFQGDERLLLFVVLQKGATLDESLEQSIRNRLKKHCSPRHVPEKVFAVPDLPRTRSGKMSEIAVKHIMNGRAVQNEGALANAECLTHFRSIATKLQEESP